MTLVLPNQGEKIALEALVNKTAPQTLELRLFTNNYTIIEGTTEASVTECTDTGYAAITLTGASWSETSGDPSYIEYAKQTFTFDASGSETIYGYYLTQATSGKLVWAENITAFPITSAGDNLSITPKITAE